MVRGRSGRGGVGPGGTADVSAAVRQGQTVLAQVLAPDDEQQTITIPAGVTNLTFSFNGGAGTPLTFSSGTTAAQVQANLSTIPALAGNVSVTGDNGGPFVVTFAHGPVTLSHRA